MISKKLLTFILSLVLIYSLSAQTTPKEKGLNSITKETVQAQLEFLSSDWMEGREATTKAEFMAGDYLASLFKLYGIKPAGDVEAVRGGRGGRRMPFPGGPGQFNMPQGPKTYFQNINFLESAPVDDQTFGLVYTDGGAKKKITFSYRTDFNLTASGVGVDFEAPIVFVGYGIQNAEAGLDDFKGIDVKGKIVFRLSGMPGIRDTGSIAYKKLKLNDRANMMTYMMGKNDILEKLGAAAVIDFTPGMDILQNVVSNYPFRFDTQFYEGTKRLISGTTGRLSIPEDTLRSGLNIITVSSRVANEILKNAGIDLMKYEKEATEKLKSASKELKGKYAFIKTTVKTKVLRGRNVVGMIEGENPNEVIVVGGHYDHVGTNDGYIWNGADDNGSGTIGVMTIAKAFAESGVKPKRTIIFACWTGEEKGLLGSKYFVDKYEPKKNLELNLNYDMIGRNAEDDTKGNKLGIQYSEDYQILKDEIEKVNKDYNLGLEIRFSPSKRPSGGSDFQSFSSKDVPVYGVMAAMHPDYHQPTDSIDKINFDKMTNIIKMGYLAVWEFANSDKKIEPSK
jgi:hypothetical protein